MSEFSWYMLSDCFVYISESSCCIDLKKKIYLQSSTSVSLQSISWYNLILQVFIKVHVNQSTLLYMNMYTYMCKHSISDLAVYVGSWISINSNTCVKKSLHYSSLPFIVWASTCLYRSILSLKCCQFFILKYPILKGCSKYFN